MFSIADPSKLFVRLKGDAKYAQSTREGIYNLAPNPINGKPHWIQDTKRNAIWYNIDFGVWNIGLLKNLGSIKTGIVSLDSTNNGPFEASNWAYVKNSKWVTASADSVVVVEDSNIPFRKTNPRKRSSSRIIFPTTVSTAILFPSRPQSFTSLMENFCQEINRVFSFSRCLIGIFP